jgi:hypothetical protein
MKADGLVADLEKNRFPGCAPDDDRVVTGATDYLGGLAAGIRFVIKPGLRALRENTVTARAVERRSLALWQTDH